MSRSDPEQVQQTQQNQPKPFSFTASLNSLLDGLMLRNRTLLAVSLTICASYIGLGLVLPVRVLYAQSHGASIAIISAMGSAYLISNFVFQYPSGRLADRWGRRPVMITGLIGQALFSLIYLFIADPLLFVILRFVEGMVGAMVLPPARALIADAVPDERRGTAYGVFSTFFNAGFLLGPALGGLVATTGYATAFIGAALLRLAAVILVVTLIRGVITHRRTEVHPSSEDKEQKTGALTLKPARARKVPYRTLFALPLLGAYILAFGDYLYLGYDQTLMPIWLHDHLGATVAIIGLVYMMWALPNMIISPLGGRIADRTRRSKLILIFGLAQVPLYITYGLVNTAILVAVLFAVHGLIYALIQPAVDSHVAAASPPDLRASVQGVYSSAGLAGAFLSSSTLGILYALNFRLPWFTIAGLFGLCVIAGGIMIRISENRGLVSGARKFYEEE